MFCPIKTGRASGRPLFPVAQLLHNFTIALMQYLHRVDCVRFTSLIKSMSKLKTLIAAYDQKGGSMIIFFSYLHQLFTNSIAVTAERESVNLHEVVDPGKQLGVDGEPAVELVTRFGHQPLSKLSLEHKNRAPA